MTHNMRVVNTYFEKAERHKITYKSGAAESQIDYILCRSSDKGNIKDGKVILGESVTNQHRQLVCTLISSKANVTKPSRVPGTKWLLPPSLSPSLLPPPFLPPFIHSSLFSYLSLPPSLSLPPLHHLSLLPSLRPSIPLLLSLSISLNTPDVDPTVLVCHVERASVHVGMR